MKNMLREKVVKIIDIAEERGEIQGVTVGKIIEAVEKHLLSNHKVAFDTNDPKKSVYIILTDDFMFHPKGK